MGKRFAAWVLGVAIAVSMLDIGATYLALRRGVGTETNPVALAAMHSSRRSYSGSPIAVYRNHAAEWLFP